MNKKRNLSKIAGMHTGTDKNGKTFYFGEVNEGCTLLILPNNNGAGDGEGRFDFIAFFAPNNRYEPAEDEPEVAGAPAKPSISLEVGITPDEAAMISPPEAAKGRSATEITPVEEKPKEAPKQKDFATIRREYAAAKAQPEEIVSALVTQEKK